MQEKTANFIQKCRFNLFAGYFFPFKRGLLDFLTHYIVDLVSNNDEKLSIAQNFVRWDGNMLIFDCGMVRAGSDEIREGGDDHVVLVSYCDRTDSPISAITVHREYDRGSIACPY